MTADGPTSPTAKPSEFSTGVSRVAPGSINIRGYNIRDIVLNASASEGAFLTIRGRRPTRGELRIFDAILCSCLDHGLVNTLSVTGRYVMSGSASLPAAIAAGILCFGPHTGSSHLTAELLNGLTAEHGSIPSDAAIDAVVGRTRVLGMNIPGLGHPIHKVTDPRTEVVREVAESEGLIGPSVELLERIRERASLIVGRQLVMNVDGLMAALLRDMGFTPGQILATNIWSAMPGIAAHAIEEACNGRRLRFPADHESAYTLPEQTLEWHQSRIDTAEANVSSVDTAEQEQAP